MLNRRFVSKASTRRSAWNRVVVALLAATLALLTTATGATGASAEPRNQERGATVELAGIPGPFKIRNWWSGLCLDVKPVGGTVESRQVYTGVCHSGDPGQRWGWFNGGFLISLARNQCATDGRDFPVQAVDFCTDWSGEHWTHRNGAIVNAQFGHCLEAPATGPGAWVHTNPCRTTTRQGWYVTYW